MAAFTLTVTETADGFDAKIVFADGSFEETIESLYDVDSCLAWGKMHSAYHDNRYTRSARLTRQYGKR